MNLEELKRLQGESFASIKRPNVKYELTPLTREMIEFRDALVLHLPAILAKLEEAQELEDLVKEYRSEYVLSDVWERRFAAFDKEQTE